MKIIWERLTLLRFASDRDDGRIPILEAALFVAIGSAFVGLIFAMGVLFY